MGSRPSGRSSIASGTRPWPTTSNSSSSRRRRTNDYAGRADLGSNRDRRRAPVERAFQVFTEDFDRIKPRDHNLLEVDIAESVFEPRAGGRVYDRGVDGSECQ